MFELSVALKYLLPRWRQLSVSIISLISVLVIALVVWLIIVFFSVTHGLERIWTEKLIALTAPVRITPTQDYYSSYYYQIDAIASAGDYATKTIGEKHLTSQADPYNPNFDEEVPAEWPVADRDNDGELKDLVKGVYASIEGLKGVPNVKVHDFEMTVGTLKLGLGNGQQLSQAAYLGSIDPENPSLAGALVEIEGDANGPVVLKSDMMRGDGILLPKNFIEAGTEIGDRGTLAYMTPTASSVQEQRIPIYVAGFYDPGIFPIGGKFILANQDVVSLIRSTQNPQDLQLANGINVRFDNLDDAPAVKQQIQEQLAFAGIDKYWKIETFREFEFTKDLLQQLSSERNIWTLISAVIIVVACSNIISMLIILVNDKKIEIGILRSMGATSRSIATIFGFCGVVMGLLGSLLGTIAAVITLRNLEALLGFISRIQGYDAFNPMFYGDSLPNEVSIGALTFVMVSTVLISLLAGIIPATKASMMRPSTILRSE